MSRGSRRCRETAGHRIAPAAQSSILLLAAALAACSDGKEVHSVTIGDAVYEVRKSHVRSLTSEPHTFVRIKPPEFEFDLVHDSRISNKLDRHGWPMIFSINEETAPDIDRYVQGDMKIVCRRAVDPTAGCGLRISHRGAEWDVLFPGARLHEAPAIVGNAQRALKAYEA